MGVGDRVDEVMVRVGEAVGLAQRGDRTGARALISALWEEVGADGDPFRRCAIAHSMADVHLRLGDTGRAGEHVVACRAALGALEDGGYRRMIVDAVERVDGQLRST
jgi:hypothetical protein